MDAEGACWGDHNRGRIGSPERYERSVAAGRALNYGLTIILLRLAMRPLGEMKMRRNRHLIAYAATALLYFGVVIGVILHQPSTQAQGVTADATWLSGARCEDARVLVALLTQQSKNSQICLISEPERQAFFRTLMRGAIY